MADDQTPEDFTEAALHGVHLLLASVNEGRIDFLRLKRRDGPIDTVICALVAHDEGGTMLMPIGRLFRPGEDPSEMYEFGKGITPVHATGPELAEMTPAELVERSRQS